MLTARGLSDFLHVARFTGEKRHFRESDRNREDSLFALRCPRVARKPQIGENAVVFPG